MSIMDDILEYSIGISRINVCEINYTTYWSLCDNTYMDTNIGSDFDNSEMV